MKCWFFHKWYKIDSSTRGQIHNRAINNGENVFYKSPPYSYERVENFVCLRCGKKKDNIQKFLNKLIKEKRDYEEIEQRAKELWNAN